MLQVLVMKKIEERPLEQLFYSPELSDSYRRPSSEEKTATEVPVTARVRNKVLNEGKNQ